MLWQLADTLKEVPEFWNGARICLDQYDMTRRKLYDREKTFGTL